jgi:hypothetical protein
MPKRSSPSFKRSALTVNVRRVFGPVSWSVCGGEASISRAALPRTTEYAMLIGNAFTFARISS